MSLPARLLVAAALAALSTTACSPPTQDFNTVPVCDKPDVNCRCPLATWIICDGKCVDPMNDPSYCGGCDPQQRCDKFCASGRCSDTCGAGRTVCGDRCADLTSDVQNCGRCGHGCSSGQSCYSGVCDTTCPASEQRCGGSCVDVKNDNRNCGACGHGCNTQVASCQSGTCRCDGLYHDCNGGCADFDSDSNNCGACGNVCSSGTSCIAGSCQ